MKLPFAGHYRTLNTVRISRDALRNNIDLYRKLFPGVAICPVLKANAYGHGLLEVAQVMEEERPAFLVVDSLYEAYELQKVGISSDILILGYTFPDNLEGRRLPFHFAVSDAKSAEMLARQGAKLHLKVDTGMNRIGFTVEELPSVLERLKALGAVVAGVLTHLADADNPVDDSYTQMQENKFKEAVEFVHRAGFEPQWIHAGATGGSHKLSGGGINAVRLGLGLYGVSPFEESDPAHSALMGLSPVMEFWSTLVGVRQLKQGDRISYNGTFTAERAMTVGVIPVGYYEGLPRALSNRGMMEVKGVICPIVGRVCMNYSMIDLSEVSSPAVGDAVVVYSRNPEQANSIRALAKLAGTIPYELMVRVAESVRREVV